MCCLFGLIDFKRVLSTHCKNKILSILSQESEVRGTDATGHIPIIHFLSKRNCYVFQAIYPDFYNNFTPERAASLAVKFFVGCLKVVAQKIL